MIAVSKPSSGDNAVAGIAATTDTSPAPASGGRKCRRYSDALGLAGIALVVVVVFSEPFLHRSVFFQRDITTYWYPHIESFVRAVGEGAWPLWNPYIAFGSPLLADPSSLGMAYPLTWLNLVLLPATYLKLHVFLHCAAGGAGVYALARRQACTALTGFSAGTAWCASGPVLSTVSMPHHLAGVAWMPWVLVALDRVLERSTAGSGILLGAAAALQALTGSADMCIATAVVAVLFALTGSRPDVRLRGLALPLLVAVTFAFALAAVQWIPTLATVGSGSRLQLDRAANTYWSLHPYSLADVLVPQLVAEWPLSKTMRAVLFESREPLLSSVYLGAAALPLALLALLLHGPPLKRFAVATVGFGVLAALGRHTFVYDLLLKLPPFRLIRYPAKFMLVAALGSAVLVGLGVDAWCRSWSESERRRCRALATVTLATAIGSFAIATVALGASDRIAHRLALPTAAPGGPDRALSKIGLTAGILASWSGLALLRARRDRAAKPLVASLVLLVAGDLALAGRSVNPVAPPELLSRSPALLADLRRDESDPRLYVVPHGSASLNQQLVRGPVGWRPEWAWNRGLQDLFLPPSSARWRICGSYDGDFSGLAPRRYSELTALVREAWGTAPALSLLRVGAVTHVVALGDDGSAGLEEVAQVQSSFAEPLRLLRVPASLPRTYVVGNARIASDDESRRILLDERFDPRHDVLLPPGSLPLSAGPGFEGKSRVEWRRMDRLALDVQLDREGYVVVVEAWAPGWKGTVDGRPADVLRANMIFRAVRVPEGRHQVELRYRPASAVFGAAMTGVTLGGVAVAGLQRARSRRPLRQADPVEPDEGSP